MELQGTPTDQLPDVLATGSSGVGMAFISLSGREPDGKDAEYLEWHFLDHRAEQHRLPGLRQSLRIVSTPACRAARAASDGHYDEVDHVMTYLFDTEESLPGFTALGGALGAAGRMPLRLPTVEFMTADLAGTLAAPRAVAGADVIPWRPALGIYLVIERVTGPADAPADALVELPGVAGVWWYRGVVAPEPYSTDASDLLITYCYLDDDPLTAAKGIGEVLQQRWASGDVSGLLAAPFYVPVPFDWTRHLPSGDVA